MKITINRKEWARGTEDGSLYDGNGCFCFVGHLCLGYGVAPASMAGQLEVIALPSDEKEKVPEFLLDEETTNAIAWLNDSEIDIVIQEVVLKELVRPHGVEVEFVG